MHEGDRFFFAQRHNQDKIPILWCEHSYQKGFDLAQTKILRADNDDDDDELGIVALKIPSPLGSDLSMGG